MSEDTYLEIWTKTGTRRKRSSWDANKFYNYFIEYKLKESQKYYLVNHLAIDDDDYEENLVYNATPYKALKLSNYYQYGGQTFYDHYNNLDLWILNSYSGYSYMKIDTPDKIGRGDIEFPNNDSMKIEIRRISNRDLSAKTIMEIFVERKDNRPLIKDKLIKMFC